MSVVTSVSEASLQARSDEPHARTKNSIPASRPTEPRSRARVRFPFGIAVTMACAVAVASSLAAPAMAQTSTSQASVYRNGSGYGCVATPFGNGTETSSANCPPTNVIDGLGSGSSSSNNSTKTASATAAMTQTGDANSLYAESSGYSLQNSTIQLQNGTGSGGQLGVPLPHAGCSGNGRERQSL